MIIAPKIRGFVCITSHPDGCAAHVREQVEIARKLNPDGTGPKNVLVIGASTGYGLSSRIVAGFGYGAATFGIFFERPAANGRPASAGYYNSVAFEKEATEEGLYAGSINGDAFSDEVKDEVVARLAAEMQPIDLVVYSLASPRRTDPATGTTHKSVLKPIGETFEGKTVDTDKSEVLTVSIDPASPEEISDTVKVMGGEDWELWINRLLEAGLLAEGAITTAYSYIGPEVTWPIYKNGTIGRAKLDLDRARESISGKLRAIGGEAFVSVNKAVVTQASSAIPVVPLYLSILQKVMKGNGTHEGCIEQIVRLFRDRMYSGKGIRYSEDGRVHVDDLEMAPAVQAAVMEVWPQISTENLRELSDYDFYQREFLRLFGFGLEGVDYLADTEVVRELRGKV
ncbi:MAG: enoyl-ACP reductase FabV [Puniceicoccaceae bacterium]